MGRTVFTANHIDTIVLVVWALRDFGFSVMLPIQMLCVSSIFLISSDVIDLYGIATEVRQFVSVVLCAGSLFASAWFIRSGG